MRVRVREHMNESGVGWRRRERERERQRQREQTCMRVCVPNQNITPASRHVVRVQQGLASYSCRDTSVPCYTRLKKALGLDSKALLAEASYLIQLYSREPRFCACNVGTCSLSAHSLSLLTHPFRKGAFCVSS